MNIKIEKNKIKKMFFGSFILASSFFILFLSVFLSRVDIGKVLAATTQDPTLSSNDAGVGTASWIATNNVFLWDNNRATVSLGKNEISNYLVATGFDFSGIPDGAVILGITVDIDRSEGDAHSNGGIKDSEVRIVQGGVISTIQNKADTATWWPASASEGYATYGSTSDLWGLSWTLAQVKASNFGVAISALDAKVTKGGGAEVAQIDHIMITVEYSADPVTDQNHFRWRNDDGTEATATWKAVEDSNVIGDVDRTTPVRIRMKATNIGVANEVATRTYELQYGVKSTTCGDIGTWTGVGNVADAWEMVESNLVDGTAITTERLTSATSFVGGEQRELVDTTSSIGPLNSGAGTEIEYSIQATASSVSGQAYCFRLYDTTGTTPLDQYSVYPEATVASEFSLEQVSYRWRNDDGGELSGNQSAGYIRPDGSISSIWAITNAATNFEALDEVIMEPTAGSEIDGYIVDSSNGSNVDDLSMTSITGSGSYTRVDVWVYAVTAGNDQLDVNIVINGVPQTAQTLSPASSYGWVSASFPSLTMSQIDLDGLSIQLAHAKKAAADSVSVATVYAEVFEDVLPASFKDADNTAITGQNKSENVRLRFLIKNNGLDASGGQNYNIEYASMVGGNCTGGDESFIGIPVLSGCGTSAVCMNSSGNFTDQLAASNISPGITDPAGSFVSGVLVEDPSNKTNVISLNNGEFTELEYNFQFTTNATDGGDYCFRATQGGTDLSTYTNIARVTLSGGGSGGYAASGTYTSQAYDLGSPKTFSIIEWTESKTNALCGDCIIKLQIKTASTEVGLGSAEWSGPEGKDGDETDFFTSALGGLVHSDHNGDQWIQYMATLTGDGVDTPILEDIKIYYK
jgi:hypothetical protein